MRLIVGLGNPGDKHKNNRHNAGFMFVDKLIQKNNLPFEFERKFDSDILVETQSMAFAKPQTYMNSSGVAVSKIINFYKIEIENLWVAHDDLDIALGEYKIHKEKGPKDHKGVGSIEIAIGSLDFWRVRIGVDNRKEDNRIPGEDYVLQDFTEGEKQILDEVIEKATNDIIGMLD